MEVFHSLHMDLCGPMRVQSINGKKYILVIIDDYSRFTWVKFLSSKDETPEFVINFLKQIQVGLNKTVRYIRTDNATEFVNQVMSKYYEGVGIFHQKSVLRTPQQNGVVERRNQAIATSCYTQNRSLIHTRHNKTPYELVHDKKPDLTFLPVFGALCYPINDSEDLVNPVAGEPGSAQSTSRDVSLAEPNQVNQPPDHLRKWTKDHPLDNIVGNPSRPVSTRKQLASDALWCCYHTVLSKVEPKNFKMVVNEDSWFEAMQDEIHEFDRLKVWEQVPRPDYVMVIGLKWIYKVKLDEYGDVLKNKARYQAKPTKKHLEAIKRIFRYLKGSINMGLWYPKDNAMSLTAYADADHAGCQDSRRSTSGSAQFLGDRLVSWSSKKQRSTAISTTECNRVLERQKKLRNQIFRALTASADVPSSVTETTDTTSTLPPPPPPLQKPTGHRDIWEKVKDQKSRMHH
ncbi:retrovirus-related pol polyprotein from transposon TNT 1-94 [Tanacetum coccineum]